MVDTLGALDAARKKVADLEELLELEKKAGELEKSIEVARAGRAYLPFIQPWYVPYVGVYEPNPFITITYK